MGKPTTQVRTMFSVFRGVSIEPTSSAFFRLITEPILPWALTRLQIITIMDRAMVIPIPTIPRFIFLALVVFSAAMGFQVVSIWLSPISIAGYTGIQSGGYWALKLSCRKNLENMLTGGINFLTPPPTLFSEIIFLPISVCIRNGYGQTSTKRNLVSKCLSVRLSLIHISEPTRR